MSSSNQNSRRRIIIITLIALIVFFDTINILFYLGIGHNFTLHYDSPYLIYIFVESALVFLSQVLFVLCLRKWNRKPMDLTKSLVLLSGSYGIALYFALFKKILTYLMPNPEYYYEKGSYISLLLDHYRITQIFLALASWFLFKIYMNIFANEPDIFRGKTSILFLTIVVIFIQIIPADYNSAFVRGGFSAIVLLQAVIIYVPVAQNSLKVYKRYLVKLDKNSAPKLRRNLTGFLFLFILAINFLLIWTSDVISSLYDGFTGTSYGPFYWIEIVLIFMMMIIFYLEFLLPLWITKFVWRLRPAQAIIDYINDTYEEK